MAAIRRDRGPANRHCNVVRLLAGFPNERNTPASADAGRYAAIEADGIMQALEELPEDPKDWANIEVDLPKLAVESCPMPMSELLEYVNMESSESNSAIPDSLNFLRTADTGGTACWIWAYTEPDGQLCYVTYRLLPNGMNRRGMASASPEWNDFKLTPEQFLLAEHYDLVYWS